VFTVLRLISFFFGGIELLLFWLFWTVVVALNGRVVVVVALGGRLVVAPVAMYAGGLLTRKTATTRNKTAMVWSCEFQVANMVVIFSKTSGFPC
jgi:hypothetical protein